MRWWKLRAKWQLAVIDAKYKALLALDVSRLLLRAAFWVALVVGLAWLALSAVKWLWR